MSTNKIIVGGIVGGIVFFLLGWLVYGVLLMDYMSANSNTCMNRPDDKMIWWAMGLANILYGFVYALVIGWSKADSIMAGAKIGLIFALFLSVSQALFYYSMTTMYANMSMVAIDVVTSTVNGVIVAAVVTWVMNRSK